jgi:hypothetical protein
MSRWKTSRSAVFLRGAYLVACFPGLALAQRLSGTVRVAQTGSVLSGVVVSVVDAGGQPLSRIVTNSVGQFSLTVAPTAQTIQVRRIGFQPQDLPVPPAARTGTATLDLTLQPIPQELEPVQVADNSTCPRVASAPTALALWDQARSGFLAAVVAQATRGLTVRLLRYDRAGSGKTAELMALDVFDQDSVRLFSAPRSADELAADGYQLTSSGGSSMFMGPDVDVLMSSSFLATHCFSVAPRDAGHSGQIGVAFAPVPTNANIDIGGVLWMQLSPLALNALDFWYVNSGRNGSRTGNSGSLQFATAANGVIAIDEWQLRLVEMLGPVTARTREVGGILVSATWADGARLGHPLGTITGVVTDADTRQPLPRVPVGIDRSTYDTTTSEKGTFQFTDVMPWTYDVTAADSTLAAFGIVRTGTNRITVTGAKPVPTPIRLNSQLDAARDACGSTKLGGGKAVLAFRILDASGSQVFGPVDVRVAPTPPGRGRQLVGHTNAGYMVICDVGTGVYDVTARTKTTTGTATIPMSGRAAIDTITVVIHGG